MSTAPWAVRLFRGKGGFNQHIGDVKFQRKLNPDPVRSPVVQVIHEYHVQPMSKSPVPDPGKLSASLLLDFLLFLPVSSPFPTP
jgi:hypothetical protein